MADTSAIEWTDSTFNPWTGCTAISAACDNCYAKELVERWGGNFDVPRRTAPANWRKPLAWNKKAAAFFAEHGRRQRVFCASLGDVFDNQIDPEWRRDLFTLIRDTQNLDWLLLTKRPQNIGKMLAEILPGIGLLWPWNNVWLGTTVENQEQADKRIQWLLDVPARVHFLSCEPLLGPINLERVIYPPFKQTHEYHPYIAYDVLRGHMTGPDDVGLPKIDWVIAGGESGTKARPMHPDWARGLRDQCEAAGTPFLYKQWGEWSDTHPDWPKASGKVMAVDGTIYEPADLAYPDGVRRAEALQAGHDKAHLTSIYRPGKKAAGRTLDGRLHDGYPVVRA